MTEGSDHPSTLDMVKPLRHVRSFADARAAGSALVGRPLTNAGTGLVATLSSRGLDKMLSGKAVAKSTSGVDQALAVANVDRLFAAARECESRPDRGGEPTIAAIRRFEVGMYGGDDRPLRVLMLVKETTSARQPNPLYTVEVQALG